MAKIRVYLKFLRGCDGVICSKLGGRGAYIIHKCYSHLYFPPYSGRQVMDIYIPQTAVDLFLPLMQAIQNAGEVDEL